MSWSDLEQDEQSNKENQHQQRERLAKAAALAKHYANCFDGPDGEAVLTDLMNKFVIHNNVNQDDNNYADRVIYATGEKGAILYMINQMEKAKIL